MSDDDQPDLFAKTHARNTDPDTSHIAAESMKEEAFKQAIKIHAVLVTIRTGHIEDIAKHLEDMDKVQVSRRMIDLERFNLARRTGVKGKLSTNRPAEIWECIDVPNGGE